MRKNKVLSRIEITAGIMQERPVSVYTYSPFHKTSFQMHMISVRFYEMGDLCISMFI